MCANAGNDKTEEELEMIQSKMSRKTFAKMYKEFHSHSEKKRLKKVAESIKKHNYTEMELAAFRREMYNFFQTAVLQ